MNLRRLSGVLLSPAALLAYTLYNHLIRTPRVRVLIWNEKGELLLVKHWTGVRAWSLPGGGVERSEPFVQAAQRELYEELRVKVSTDELQYEFTHHAGCPLPIFSVVIHKDALLPLRKRSYEIVEMGWFGVQDIPPDVSAITRAILQKISKND